MSGPIQKNRSARSAGWMRVMMTVRAYLIVFAVTISPLAFGAVPLMINHQGLVKVNALPFTGNGLFKFGFIDAAGKWLWTNDGSHVGQSAGAANPDAAVVLPANNGIYNVNLGDTSITNMVAIPSSVFDSDDVTLRVIFNDGVTGEQILLPDQPITSAAFAYHAAQADDSATVGGRTVAQLSLVGEVKMWAGTIAGVPEGWLPCDGRELSRTTYADLLAVIGTIYGAGDGSTTFNLPDLRDRSPMGARQDDDGVPKTNVSGSLSQAGGAATHVLTVDELASHTHQQQGSPNGGTNIPATLVTNSGLNYSAWPVRSGKLDGSNSAYPSSSPPIPQNTVETGAGQPHNVLDPYLAMTFIIKY